ncbi:MAG TPA: hexose kinase [Pedococcus sp.]|nr:hexose kinase [Pedococcus sp.]
MILTVTPNPALDVTYDVDRLVPHTSHRVRQVRERAGGKGVNVASVLAFLGEPVLVTGVVGGASGDELRGDLERRGIRHDLLAGELPTRRTVTVVSAQDGDATAFNEPGSPWPGGLRDALVVHVERLLRVHRPAVLVVSGSVPPGFGGEGCAALVSAGRAAGSRVVLDTSQDALVGALPSGPDVVKPNRDELYAVTGTTDPVEGANALQDKGAQHVLVSLGADGMVLVGPDGTVRRARLPEPLRGNPTGAGDACVAGVARGLAGGSAWPDVLADAVAWSAAAVLSPVAGEVSVQDVARLRAVVTVEDAEVR